MTFYVSFEWCHFINCCWYDCNQVVFRDLCGGEAFLTGTWELIWNEAFAQAAAAGSSQGCVGGGSEIQQNSASDGWWLWAAGSSDRDKQTRFIAEQGQSRKGETGRLMAFSLTWVNVREKLGVTLRAALLNPANLQVKVWTLNLLFLFYLSNLIPFLQCSGMRFCCVMFEFLAVPTVVMDVLQGAL